MKRFLIFCFLFAPLFAMSKPEMVIYNSSQDKVIEGSLQPTNQVSIASISKLMTVYTVLQEHQPLTEKLSVVSNKTSNTRISKGMTLTREDLIKLALVSSDNLASITLAQNYSGGTMAFVKKMNENARMLNMYNTGFVEPSGLSPMNYSTLHDIVQLTNAVSQYSIVNDAAKTKQVIATTTRGKRSISIKANSTSTFFGSQGLVAIKTGFTRAAGFCITMAVNANNQKYNIVVLGATNATERNRIIEDALHIIYNI